MIVVAGGADGSSSAICRGLAQERKGDKSNIITSSCEVVHVHGVLTPIRKLGYRRRVVYGSFP